MSTTSLERILLPYLLQQSDITVPSKFPEQVKVVKELLDSDTSGLLNSILDFAIDCASGVNYTIETSNKNLSETLNEWLYNINVENIGKVETGINSLAKQYFMERWKYSSFPVLRSIWSDVDGWLLPTSLWFVDGENVEVKDNAGDTKVIGAEEYYLKVGKADQAIHIPASADEKVFVQRPFEKWGTTYPTPFIIKRGLYKNAKGLDLLAKKGDSILSKAIEYLLLLKKGNADLIKTNNEQFIYDEADLKGVVKQLETLVQEMRLRRGSPTYATNFDTEMEHVIPEYSKVLKAELFVAYEKRILAGAGFIPMSGIAGSRQEMMLNPRPFQAQVMSGVSDFQCLMIDIVKTILQVNADAHRKHTNVKYIEFRKSPIRQFLTKDDKDMLRSVYDRGNLSKRTFTEICGESDFDAEIERRSVESGDNLDEKMYPHPVQYTDKAVDIQEKVAVQAPKTPTDGTPSDKTGAEKRNYVSASLIAEEIDTDVFTNKKDALNRAKELKSSGYHVIELNDRAYFKPCKTEEVYVEKLEKEKERERKEEAKKEKEDALLQKRLENANKQGKLLDGMES